MGKHSDKVHTNDIFVVIPGVMGSVLTKKRADGKKDLPLWSPAFSTIGRALRYRTKNLLALRLEHEPKSLEDLEGDIVAEALMPDVHIIPRFWKIDGYGALSQFVKNRFDVTPGETFFEFSYDWRLDNRINAELLRQQAKRWVEARCAAGTDAKLVILAHSVGGLISRYFIEVLGGWKITRRLFTIGTPHRGSLKALDFIANGYHPVAWGLKLPELDVLTQLVRSFTSTYQLLPTYPCYQDAAGQLHRATEIADVEGLNPERVAAGIAFHEEIRAAREANRGVEAYQAQRYDLHAVVGSHQETAQSMRSAKGRLTVENALGGEDLKGDGTVPYASALPFEMEDEPDKVKPLYVPEKHSRLQNAKPVHIQIEGTVTTAGIDLAAFKDAARGLPLALDLPDAFLEGEELTFRVHCESDWTDLGATLFDAVTGAELDHLPVPADEGQAWRSVRRAPLPEGTYRLEVSSPKAGEARPVTDVFSVL